MCKSFGEPAPAQYLSLLVFPTRLFNQFDKLCKIFLPFSQTSKAALLEKWNKYSITKNILADYLLWQPVGDRSSLRHHLPYARRDPQSNHFFHLAFNTPQCHKKQLKAIHATHATQYNAVQLKLQTHAFHIHCATQAIHTTHVRANPCPSATLFLQIPNVWL